MNGGKIAENGVQKYLLRAKWIARDGLAILVLEYLSITTWTACNYDDRIFEPVPNACSYSDMMAREVRPNCDNVSELVRHSAVGEWLRGALNIELGTSQ